MKNLFYISLLSAILFVPACTDNFDELNTNPKSLTVDKLDQGTFGLAAAPAFYFPVHVGVNDRGSFQLAHSLFADIYANYMATTAPNFDSDKFTLVGRWLNGVYVDFYADAAPQIKYVVDFSADNGFAVENAIFKVWKVFAYHRTTDYWGPIPYSQFGNGEKVVPFDSQEDIYRDFFKTLDEAIAVLKSNAGKTSFLGGNDVVFGGNIDKWTKFANSLKLRLAMRVRYVDAGLAKTNAESAVASGIIELNTDNGFVKTSNNWRNSYTTITQWSEYRMSGDMESILKGYLDPRMAMYFAPAKQPDPSDDPPGISFPYEGMRNGQSKEAKQGSGFNEKASDQSAPYTLAESAGPPWPLIKASEVYFLRAEGALIGWNMGGSSAKEFYDQGIQSSMEEYGFDGTDLAGNDYVSSTNVPGNMDASTPPVSTVPIAYDGGGSTERQLEQIITQKWIALYPNSWECWSERRRTGYPTLYPRLFTDDPAIPVTSIPRRVPYTSTEYDNNADGLATGLAKLGGPDNGVTKLWWDKK
ncbi:MAG: SusD/RagB family nutrient-binding outer membrane lipoprotein [Saprospiraceae bacterium]|nr:SusD/RagB family nutrient-binding outer membrane lipoprotein [Saprospiraceae bacterium]